MADDQGANPTVDAFGGLGEPTFLRIKIFSWEDRILSPEDAPLPGRVRDLKRFLPEEISGPIYERLECEEQNIVRCSEPFHPFKIRLVRLEPAIFMHVMPFNQCWSRHRHKVTPHSLHADACLDWDSAIRTELARARRKGLINELQFAKLGAPAGSDPIDVGYRIDVDLLSGREVGPEFMNYSGIVMTDHILPLDDIGPIRDVDAKLLGSA